MIRSFIKPFTLACTLTVFTIFFPPVITISAEMPGTESISGKIVEAMNAAGYTYVNLSTANGPLWVALPQTALKVGDEISCKPGMEMKDFYSNSFNRTFASIIFSEGVIEGEPGNPHASALVPAATSQEDSFEAAVESEKQAPSATQIQPQLASAGSMGAIAPFVEITVEKAEGENAFTVGDLFDKAEELNGQTIRVRGKVVKYNANIMGKNWLHIQDGTGDPMKNTHDLVITTSQEIGSPSVLTLEGKLVADKDFGAGYSYDVIIENGSIVE
ncbi:MAG: DNA-binding protein [Desulfobacterales bacterium]|nr:DNA-binding protein [Desulfobacterales bacterium]